MKAAERIGVILPGTGMAASMAVRSAGWRQQAAEDLPVQGRRISLTMEGMREMSREMSRGSTRPGSARTPGSPGTDSVGVGGRADGAADEPRTPSLPADSRPHTPRSPRVHTPLLPSEPAWAAPAPEAEAAVRAAVAYMFRWAERNIDGDSGSASPTVAAADAAALQDVLLAAGDTLRTAPLAAGVWRGCVAILDRWAQRTALLRTRVRSAEAAAAEGKAVRAEMAQTQAALEEARTQLSRARLRAAGLHTVLQSCRGTRPRSAGSRATAARRPRRPRRPSATWLKARPESRRRSARQRSPRPRRSKRARG